MWVARFCDLNEYHESIAPFSLLSHTATKVHWGSSTSVSHSSTSPVCRGTCSLPTTTTHAIRCKRTIPSTGVHSRWCSSATPAVASCVIICCAYTTCKPHLPVIRRLSFHLHNIQWLTFLFIQSAFRTTSANNYYLQTVFICSHYLGYISVIVGARTFDYAI